MSELSVERQHEPTCAYYGLRFKAGSGNRICSCPGRAIAPVETCDTCTGKRQVSIDGGLAVACPVCSRVTSK